LDIIDAGAGVGDSALVLSQYTDKTVHSFEPASTEFASIGPLLERNKVTNVVTYRMALGEKNDEVTMNVHGGGSSILYHAPHDPKEKVAISTLDSIVEEKGLRVGLIKTDLEGYEQLFLKGAEKTIKKQKPVLLISIYHNADDFFNIKPLLEDWSLGYKFHFFKPLDGTVLIETVLIAYT
jgi:FkbM family methyltransferase